MNKFESLSERGGFLPIEQHGLLLDPALDQSSEFTDIYFSTIGSQPVVVKVLHPGCGRYQEDRLFRNESWAVDSMNQAVAPPPVEVPVLLDAGVKEGRSFLIMSCVEGRVHNGDEFRSRLLADEGMQEDLGKKIGQFVHWLEAAIPMPDTAREENPALPFDRSAAFLSVLGYLDGLTARGFPGLAGILSGLKDEYYGHFPGGRERRTIIGHDDLYSSNLALSPDGHLAGVFDFGATKPSTPERELRYLAVYNLTTALNAAAQAYEKASGKPVDLDMVDFWARIQVASMMAFRVLRSLKPLQGEACITEALERCYVAADLDCGELQRLPGHFFMKAAGIIVNRNGESVHLLRQPAS